VHLAVRLPFGNAPAVPQQRYVRIVGIPGAVRCAGGRIAGVVPWLEDDLQRAAAGRIIAMLRHGPDLPRHGAGLIWLLQVDYEGNLRPALQPSSDMLLYFTFPQPL